MNRIFGSSSKDAKKPTLDDAIQRNESRIDAAEVKLRKLDAELTRYREQMNRMRPGAGKAAVQKRAIAVLKQKKMHEAQRDAIQSQNFNMESTQLTTDNLRGTMATVDAMKSANKEMKKQYGKIDVNQIEDLQYDMEDLMEQANEIQESMSRNYAVPDDLDEADLEAELDALGDELNFETEQEPAYLKDAQASTANTEMPDFADELGPQIEAQKQGPQAEKVV